MRKTYQVISLLSVFFLVVVTGCDFENKNMVDSLSGEWELEGYHNLKTKASISEPAYVKQPIVIKFSDNGKSGKIKGRTVVNEVYGEYELLEPGRINVYSFGGTKIGEPYWGEKFWDAIYNATSYRCFEDELYIYFNNDTEVMKFIKS